MALTITAIIGYTQFRESLHIVYKTHNSLPSTLGFVSILEGEGVSIEIHRSGVPRERRSSLAEGGQVWHRIGLAAKPRRGMDVLGAAFGSAHGHRSDMRKHTVARKKITNLEVSCPRRLSEAPQ